MDSSRLTGIGMTSARTRERLVQRLQEQGIADQRVLDRIRNVPRHLFVDEALASRAYEDTALPIGFGQTISQPYIVARMTAELFATGPVDRVLEIGTGCGYQSAVLAPMVDDIYTIERIGALVGRARRTLRELKIRNVHFRHDDGSVGWAARAPFDAILLTAAPHAVPEALYEQLMRRRAPDRAGRTGWASRIDLLHQTRDGDGAAVPRRRKLRAPAVGTAALTRCASLDR